MKCRDCPMIKDQFNNRMRMYYESIEEGVADKIYGNMTEEDVEDDAEDYCWCDKMGYKLWCTGICNQNDVVINKHIANNKSKSTKRLRQEKYIEHLKHLSKITYYPQAAMYIDEKWDKEIRKYIPIDKSYYKRCYKSNHKGGRYRYYKKYSNRKIRRYNGVLKSGNMHRKVFDYWYTVI